MTTREAPNQSATNADRSLQWASKAMGMQGTLNVSQSAQEWAMELKTHFEQQWEGDHDGVVSRYFQRAMDAAVALRDRDIQGLHETLHGKSAEVASLAKELAEERELRRHAEKQAASGNGLYTAIIRRVAIYFPEGERGLDWDVLPGFLGGAISDLKQQLSAAQSALAERDKTIADYQRRLHNVQDIEKGYHGLRIAELQNALAEKEKELAEEKEKCKHMQIAFDNAALANRSYRYVERELSTERAAREKAESEAFDLRTEKTHLILDVDALRAQLQQAERERDEARSLVDCAENRRALGLIGDGDEEIKSLHRVMDESTRNYERQLSSLRAELAATQEARRDLVQERAILEESNRLLTKEHNALQKQNAELSGSLKALEELLRKDPDSTDHSPIMAALGNITEERDTLKARNAELVKALTDWIEWWETVAPKQRGPIYEESVKLTLVRPDALNQSPE